MFLKTICLVWFVTSSAYAQEVDKVECKYTEECVASSQCKDGLVVYQSNVPFKNSILRAGCDRAQSMVCCLRPPEKCGFSNIVTSDVVNSRVLDVRNAKFAEFPWNVALLNETRPDVTNRKNYFCGGALIHPKVAITAAHCVFDREPSYIVVRAGQTDFTKYVEKDIRTFQGHKDLFVDRIIVHENFKKDSLHNDIALVVMRENFQMQDNIGIICLPNENQSFDNNVCTISGFGKVFDFGNYFPIHLKKTELEVLPRKDCIEKFRNTDLSSFFVLHESFICAGGEDGKDSCDGDGGAPLVSKINEQNERFCLAGITSWGLGCGFPNIPGSYVNVAHFRNWIDGKMKENSFTTMYQI